MQPIDQALEWALASVGTEFGVSNWITIDQPMIDQFAAVTMDDQFIHVDPARASTETPFGGTIAHGYLVLSLASRFAMDCFDQPEEQVMGMNYGFDKVRFISPVRCNARVRGRFTMLGCVKKSDTALLQTNQLTVEIDGSEKPALIAEWLTMAFFA